MNILLTIYLIMIVVYVAGLVCCYCEIIGASKQGHTFKKSGSSRMAGILKLVIIGLIPILNVCVGIYLVFYCDKLLKELEN